MESLVIKFIVIGSLLLASGQKATIYEELPENSTAIECAQRVEELVEASLKMGDLGASVVCVAIAQRKP